ncbi:hypothetical protein BKH46_08355 [Helicobacter sp. 12S02634-8]|uniref:hypothetical protein n=1 Tax=Helicobacter sp. 12S02634-8 TaxID=1476199 RepID=UPI000BA7244E|nr:hypothetical protein [Helicobacter sp. 12S02634-8]PAF46242.1 hypothetical protein BKH46_08355 [Helicobacter sp. 12S02634-8]
MKIKKTSKGSHFVFVGSSGNIYDSRFYFEDRGFIKMKIATPDGKREKGVLSPLVDSLREVVRG